MASFAPPADALYLVYGKTGWIGGKIIEMLKESGKKFVLSDNRTYNRESVAAELDSVKPTHVINAAGVTGRPNVDWCEDHKVYFFFFHLLISLAPNCPTSLFTPLNLLIDVIIDGDCPYQCYWLFKFS